MTTQQPFDPTQYLVKLKRRQKTAEGGWQTVELDYLEVRNRLVWLRHEHPNAHISTEIHRLEGDLCVVTATVMIPDGGSASGIGSETADDWKDFIEKAETKAVGRALAALGYGTQFTEEYDFAGGNPEKVVDAPAQRPKADSASSGPSSTPSANSGQTHPRTSSASSTPSSSNGGGQAPAGGWQDRPATDPQIKAIYAIARGTQAMYDGTLAAWCTRRFGEPPERLSRRQASEAIDALKLGVAS